MGTGALPPLPLGATLEVSELPYVVTGTTVPEIRLSLSTAATEALEGSSVDLHRSSLTLDYRYGQQGEHCVMTWIGMELELAIEAPGWTDREAADSALVSMWDTYLTTLRGHELTHQEYLHQQARDISRELYHIESPTCLLMAAMAISTAARIDERYRQLNQQFDEENGNITWPPQGSEAGALSGLTSPPSGSPQR
jgi:predicted secreted Zn-dependent protease